MATVSTSLPSFMSGDADFRTVGSTISAALATCGLVQTADTGQINWTTVTKPVATNTAAGYEIWRFADTLQSTTPVFIKVEYGTGGAVDRPSLWITAGSSSNGSGTISGQVGTRAQVFPSASKTAGNTQPAYISGDGGRISVAFNQDTSGTTFPCTWLVERTRDNTGAATADAVFFAASSQGNSSTVRQTVPGSGTVPGTTFDTAWIKPHDGSTQASATAAPLSPAILFAKGSMFFGIGWLHYETTDISAGVAITVNLFGTTHTYMPLGPNQGPAWGGSATGVGVAMLWE